MFLAALFASFLALSLAGAVKNVPYHRQITEFSCGDATVEMLLHWSGMDVDQRAIMDVMRTSPNEGTLRWVGYASNVLYILDYFGEQRAGDGC